MKDLLVVNLQQFSIHDGPGIRTTAFFKGCPLACRWCHNPETQSFAPQLLHYRERCTGCGRCAAACPRGCVALGEEGPVTDPGCCDACGRCAVACAFDAREVAGRAWAPLALAEELSRDRLAFENSGGGVTLSGGEPLAQDGEALLALLRRLQRQGIHTAVDTCGHLPWEKIQPLLPYVDLFLYDWKAADPKLHQGFTGRGNRRILENLARLAQGGAQVNLRVPVIGGFNEGDREMEAMAAAVKGLGIRQVNLLPYHNTGRDKWARMGRETPQGDFFAPEPERMEALAGLWRRGGFPQVEIGG